MVKKNHISFWSQYNLLLISGLLIILIRQDHINLWGTMHQMIYITMHLPAAKEKEKLVKYS